MKKLFTLLTLLLGATCTMQAGDVYEWSHNEVFKTLSVTAAKGTSAASTYSGYTITYETSKGPTTCSSAVKMESATTLTFETAAKATITIGVVLKDGNTYSVDNAKLSFDGTTTDSPITAETKGAKKENAVYVTLTDVAAGTHVVKRADKELGICYIKVEETGAVLTKLDAPTITVDTSTGEVTIGSVTNSKITYTTDGTIPTAESTEYTTAFTVEDGVTVMAIAVGDQETYSNSDVATKQVLLDNVTVADPVISHYNGTVAISCETVASTIEYSLDGTNYQSYSRAFTLSKDAVVYARAMRGSNTSQVVSAEVAIVSKGEATKTLWLAYDMFNDNTKNSMTGKTGTDAEGFTLAITGKTDKKWSYGSCDITTAAGELQTIKLSNGAENTITFPEGLKATRITFYSVINSGEARTSYWYSFKGEAIENGDDVPMGAWNTVSDRLTNPDVRVFPLNGDETSIKFQNTGEQLLFVIAVDVISDNQDITIGDNGWATAIAAKALDFSGVSGLTAYTATLADSKVTLKEVQNVPAGTGVVLKGTAGAYSVPFTDASTTDKGDLLGSYDETTEMVSTNTYYGLTMKDGNAVFAKLNQGTIPAGKAYLMVEGSNARSFFDIEGETTAIEAVNSIVENGTFYNLQGQRINAPQKGLYIVNGKKVIIK